MTVTFAPLGDEYAYVEAVPLVSADSAMQYFTFGLSRAGSSWSSPLPPWATHADLTAREFFVDGRMSQISRRAPIGSSTVLDRVIIPSSPMGARANISPAGVLTASWPAVDARADLVVLALQIEGVSPTTGESVDLNWQIMAAPSSEEVGPLPLGAATWLAIASIGLSNVIAIAGDEWENYADVRATTHSVQWYLDHGPGSCSLAPFDATLE